VRWARRACAAAIRAASRASVAVLAAGAALAHADVAPGDLGTVTVTARLPRPVAEAAAAVTVVDEAALDALVVRDLGDLARYEPGLAVRHDATRFGVGDFSIRGVGGNRVLIEVDGVPAAAAFAVGSFADTGRSYLDLDLANRVEILRGPASSLYGSEALGGVLSIRTWNAADLLDEDGVATRVRTAWRGDDQGLLYSAVAAARDGPGELLVAYAGRDAGELDTASKIVEANPRDVRSRGWIAKAQYGKQRPVQLAAERQERAQQTDVCSLVLQPGRYVNTITMRGDDSTAATGVSLGQRFLDERSVVRAEWRAYWRDTGVLQQTYERRRAAGAAPATEIYRRFRYDAVVLGAEGTASREIETGRIRHELVTGFEADRSRLTELRDAVQTAVSSGATTRTILGESFPLRDFPETTLLRAGVYLQDRIVFVGGRSAWIPALRIDHYRLRPHLDPVYVDDNPRTTPVSLSTTALSPRLGYTWAATQRTTVYGQYAHGFRAPPFEDVNVGLDLPAVNARAIPNPDLEAERSDGFEVGVRMDRGPVRGGVSAFYNRYRDFIESKVNLGRDVAGTTIFQSRNVASARILGVEASGTWDLGANAATLEGVSLRAALHHARGDDTARHRPLNAVEPTKAVLGATFAAPSHTWGAGITVVAVAAKRRVDDSAAAVFRTAGFSTIDVDAFWRPADGVDVRVAILNAGGRSYFEWADVRGRAVNDPTLEWYRRPGRSYTLSMTLRL
jgi:hemoglobin/transferrin/lactoferrin receptor protein